MGNIDLEAVAPQVIEPWNQVLPTKRTQFTKNSLFF